MGDSRFPRDGHRFERSVPRLAGLRAQREKLADRSVPFNVGFLDDIALGLLPTDLVVIGAETGAGKTTLGMLLGLMSARRGLNVDYIALEAYRGEIEQRLLFAQMARLAWERSIQGRERFTYAALMHGLCDDIANQIESEALETLEQELGSFRVLYRDGSFGVDDIAPTLEQLKDHSDLVVFDHLHYVDLAEESSENRSMRRVVVTLGDMVNALQIPVIAIAHLRKKQQSVRHVSLVPDMHEFHGSSDITKTATKVVTLAPARDRANSDPYIANTYMAVDKDRLAGRSHYAAIVSFDQRTLSYHDSYTLGTLSPLRDKFRHLRPDQRPWWAERARCLGAPESEIPDPAQEELPMARGRK